MDNILENGNGLLNEIPRVKWLNPSIGSAFHSNINALSSFTIPLEVDAFDIDGDVERVEFWVNNQKINTIEDAPYKFSWSPTESGHFIFKTLVVDNEGREIWSRENPIYMNISNANLTTTLQQLIISNCF